MQPAGSWNWFLKFSAAHDVLIVGNLISID